MFSLIPVRFSRQRDFPPRPLHLSIHTPLLIIFLTSTRFPRQRGFDLKITRVASSLIVLLFSFAKHFPTRSLQDCPQSFSNLDPYQLLFRPGHQGRGVLKTWNWLLRDRFCFTVPRYPFRSLVEPGWFQTLFSLTKFCGFHPLGSFCLCRIFSVLSSFDQSLLVSSPII